MAFVTRQIGLRFELGIGQFGADGLNIVEFSGLRCQADIAKPGGGSMSRLDLRVWGMPLDVMRKLTVLNSLFFGARLNQITVSAGDAGQPLAVVFDGTITEAWADLQAAPDAAFVVTAMTGYVASVRPVAPVSFKGSVDVAELLASIASTIDPPLGIENSGVKARLLNPYYPGTAMDQIRAVARDAGINALIDGNTLAIWPTFASRGALVPVIAPETGLIGYPAFTQNSIRLRTLFNPTLAHGQRVEVHSLVEQANGQWNVANITHNLSAELPGGPWFTDLECGYLGAALPVVTS
jgi:hypothetical protein